MPQPPMDECHGGVTENHGEKRETQPIVEHVGGRTVLCQLLSVGREDGVLSAEAAFFAWPAQAVPNRPRSCRARHGYSILLPDLSGAGKLGHLTRHPPARSEPLLPLTHRDPDLLLLQVELGHERGHLLVLKVLPVIGQKLRACRLDGRQPQVEPRG